jgi:uncharacterized protein YbaR (Trm112 family)
VIGERCGVVWSLGFGIFYYLINNLYEFALTTSKGAIMDTKLMDILCCPECKGELELKVLKQEGNEIFKGDLICGKCKVTYTIDDGIPNLLPKEYHDNSE